MIGVESGKQLSEIRKLNEGLDSGFKSFRDEVGGKFDEMVVYHEGNRDLIGVESGKQLSEIRKLNDDYNNFRNETLQNQNIFKSMLDNNFDVTQDLNVAVNLFIQNYSECKRYFFNDNENILKKYLDTDDLFRLCYFNNIKFVSFSPSENIILLKSNEGIIFATNNRFTTLKGVIGFDEYSVPQLYQFDDFVVFDIGMNRAYASLRFANFENCSKIYGFEIDEQTYQKALYNINLNPKLSKKIVSFNFGLSNKEDTLKLYYLEGSDGLSTIKKEFTHVQDEFKMNANKIKYKLVNVKKTSEIINNILEKDNIDSKIVLKIDTEGSEYDIIDDLIDSNLISKIDLILGEGHIFNNRTFSKELVNKGFKEIERKDHNIVYTFAYVREEYHDVWPLKEYM